MKGLDRILAALAARVRPVVTVRVLTLLRPLVSVALIAWVSCDTAFAGPTSWIKAFGVVRSDDRLYSMVPTPDGGMLAVGKRMSDRGDMDAWVVKLSDSGSIEWEQVYGGPNPMNDWLSVVQRTSDGGFILGGSTYSADTPYRAAGLLIKLNSYFGFEWQAGRIPYSLPIIDSVAQLADGGYAAVSGTSSACVLAGDGTLVRAWSLNAVESSAHYPLWADSVEAVEGGFIVVGTYMSRPSDQEKSCAVKFTVDGDPVWTRFLAAPGGFIADAATATADGGCVIAGYSVGTGYASVLRLTSSGRVAWDYRYGVGEVINSVETIGRHIVLAVDGGIWRLKQSGTALEGTFLKSSRPDRRRPTIRSIGRSSSGGIIGVGDQIIGVAAGVRTFDAIAVRLLGPWEGVCDFGQWEGEVSQHRGTTMVDRETRLEQIYAPADDISVPSVMSSMVSSPENASCSN